MRTRVVAGWVVLAVVAGVVGLPVVGAMPAESVDAPSVQHGPSATPIEPLGSAARASVDEEIRITTTLNRTPERVGEITATVSFQFPDRVSELTARLPEGATVTETDGFDRGESETDYEWDERTDRPSVTFRVDANQLSKGEGPLAEDGRYLFTETDEWALVRIPSSGARWLQTGEQEISVSRETEIEGPGTAGDRMAFLGPHDIETHTAHGQTFRLVVPEAAALAESPADIFDSLSHASDTLRVGDRDEQVLVIAAPTDDVDWGVRGLQLGDAEMWVQDTERLDLATNVWVHEYVHTRQAYQRQTTAETRWLTEGTASYYAALLTLEQGRIEFDRFQRVLGEGELPPQSKSVLSRPDSWQNNANYWKGSLVAGELDRQIRLETGSEASFETVFRSLNGHAETGDDATISAREFERYVTAAGGDDVAANSTRFTSTEAVPAMWDAETHGAVFGQAPARFSYRLAADDSIRISGVDRTESLGGSSGTLTVGETLTVDMIAENVGGTVGSYELVFTVNETRTIATGRLAPNETATHQFSHTFSEPGQYTVSVGDEELDIRVEEPDPTAEEGSVDVETPGFGVITAVWSLLVFLVVTRHRR